MKCIALKRRAPLICRPPERNFVHVGIPGFDDAALRDSPAEDRRLASHPYFVLWSQSQESANGFSDGKTLRRLRKLRALARESSHTARLSPAHARAARVVRI